MENIFQCWNLFRRGKRKKKDVQFFERYLENNIFQLHHDLITLRYQHDSYENFYVTDPKRRCISKATVKDRLVHQIVYSGLNLILDKKFIFHSLSSHRLKGTHVGIFHLRRMIRKVSANGHRPCYALKMDIKRFFDTIDHNILKHLIRKNIYDEKFLKIIDTIIDSFNKGQNVGVPLGNVTSQLFANLYLHELDCFIKKRLKIHYYLRYCDDFIILSSNRFYLASLIGLIKAFLEIHLHLTVHPKKISIRKLNQGIDFIGTLIFEKYTLVRTRTKQRMKKKLKKIHEMFLNEKIDKIQFDQSLQSYLGILSHVNQHTLSQALRNAHWTREGP